MDSLSRLEQLNLGFNNLSGKVPPFYGLVSAIFEYNYFTGEIPAVFNESKSSMNTLRLEHLNLAWNKLSGTIPSSFSNLSSLEFLVLGGNKLSGTIPSSFSNLSSLGA